MNEQIQATEHERGALRSGESGSKAINVHGVEASDDLPHQLDLGRYRVYLSHYRASLTAVSGPGVPPRTLEEDVAAALGTYDARSDEGHGVPMTLAETTETVWRYLHEN